MAAATENWRKRTLLGLALIVVLPLDLALAFHCASDPKGLTIPTEIILGLMGLLGIASLGIRSNKDETLLALGRVKDRSWDYYKWATGLSAGSLAFSLAVLSKSAISHCPGFLIGSWVALGMATLFGIITVKTLFAAELIQVLSEEEAEEDEQVRTLLSHQYSRVQVYGQLGNSSFIVGLVLVAWSVLSNL